ncbi:unnamed protein product, partial [Owenia fusiformis]
VDYRTWSPKASVPIPEVEAVPNYNRGGYTYVDFNIDEYGLFIAYIQKDWTWKDMPNTCINAETLTATSASTLEECKQKCVNEGGFRCMSLDWSLHLKQCNLKLRYSGNHPLTSPCTYRWHKYYWRTGQWHHSERKFADPKRASYIQIKQLNPID